MDDNRMKGVRWGRALLLFLLLNMSVASILAGSRRLRVLKSQDSVMTVRAGLKSNLGTEKVVAS